VPETSGIGNPRDLIMNAKQVFQLSIVAVALAAAAPMASAQDEGLTRAEAKAAVLQARARGELIPAGQAVQPFAMQGTGEQRTRADVRNEVLLARADGELVPAGQGMTFNARVPSVSLLARAEVKESVRIARQRGELTPAGEGMGPTERQAHAYPARSATYAANRPR
jgi:hypothetical protein